MPEEDTVMAMIKDGENIEDKEVLSVLMVGQSNMAGRGNIGDVPDIKNPDCFMLRNGRWQPLKDPINVDRPVSGVRYPAGVSLGGSFADTLAKYTGKKVGMIPCADGGTNVSQWQPGELLYDHAIMQCKLAQRTSRLVGIIWHQGESDALTETAVYREKLLNVFEGFRRDLGIPDLPIIAGEISENTSDNWHISGNADRINRVFHRLEWELPNYAVTSAKGLTLKDDGIHFDAVSLREFGVRYCEKFINDCKSGFDL